MQDKPKSVVNFYVLCAQLKDVIRTGWTKWNVRCDRLESIAEHIFGVQQLAIAMWSQYNYQLDIFKVITMLAIHELEEVIIGDLTAWDVSREDKKAKGHAAVQFILQDLVKKDEIAKLIFEFDARETPEAKFAYYCDKLECDIQSKLYDEQNCVDLNNQENNPIMRDQYVKGLLDSGKSWSSMWLEFGRNKIGYDKNFTEVSKYVENNMILLKSKNNGK